MKIVIIGASGQIGNALYHQMKDCHAIIGTHCNDSTDESLVFLDITDPQAVGSLLRAENPEVVILTSALTHVDRCEMEPALAYRINVEGVAHLLEPLRATGARLVYFSTDYIFDGRNGPYREDDPPAPLNVYGRNKLEAETLIRRNLQNFLIVRVTNVYGWEPLGKNFVMGLIGRLKRGETMRLPVDQVATPTYVGNLAEAVQELIEAGHNGIYNVVGADLLDRYQFGCLAANIFGLDHSLLLPVTTEELGQPARRPLMGGLRIDKARSVLQTPLLGARQGLGRMKRETLESQNVSIQPGNFGPDLSETGGASPVIGR